VKAGGNCGYCGRPNCREHDDLPAAAISIFDQLCTRTADCPADVDQHAADCPVERELIATFGF